MISTVEGGASSLLSQLLDYNAKAKKTEELMEIMEQERYFPCKVLAASSKVMMFCLDQ